MDVIFGGIIDEEDVVFLLDVGELSEFIVIIYGDYCVIVLDSIGEFV